MPHRIRLRYLLAKSQIARSSLDALIVPLLLAALLSACAGKPFLASDPAGANFIDRAISQEKGAIRVMAAVPDDAETVALTGLPLYEQGIQPVWLEVTNSGTDRLRLALSSIDPDYYSPLEVAWMNRAGLTREARAAAERWFHENGMVRWIPPGESRAGLIFTHVTGGTKGFNVDLFTSPDTSAQSFTFFVPMPGFVADHMEIDFNGLYERHEEERLSSDELRLRIREATCCGTDETGRLQGDAFNIVLVATPLAVRRALLRGGWQETEAGAAETAIARKQRYRGRQPDGTFMKRRLDGTEQNELRLWLTPFETDGRSIWFGQVLYSLGNSREQADALRRDPDIDEARNYFLQDLWYSQSAERGTLTRAVDPVPESSPVMTFTGSRYHTDGLCAVVWLSEGTIALDDIELLGWWGEDKDQ